MKLVILLSVALCLLLCVRADVDSSKLWDQYRSELLNFLRQGDKNAMKNLQLVTTPHPAEWDESPELFDEIVGKIPKWGASWELSRRRFQDVYFEFLSSLQLPPRNTKIAPELNDLEDELFDAQMHVEDLEDACAVKFDKYQDRRRQRSAESAEDLFTWNQFKQRFCDNIRFAENEVILLRGEIEIKNQRSYGPMYDAAMAIGRFSSTPVNERVFVAMGSLGRFAKAAQDGQTNSFQVKISERTKVDVGKTSTFGMSFGVSIPIVAGINLGVNGEYQSSKMTFTSNAEEVQIQFGAGGWKAIPVYPSRTWCDLDVIKKYANGPFVGAKKDFFSKNGLMPLIPRTIFVMVKPEVEMFVNKQDKETMEKSSSFSVGITVGPLNFNFNKGDEKKFDKEHDKLFKVTMIGNDPTPQILAVDNLRLPYDL